MRTHIAALSTRPDLAALVAAWRVHAFFGDQPGWTVERYAAALLQPADGPEETFVLFDDDEPAATASLMHDDLAARPDLTPWLAGVFVRPEYRGRGHAAAVVRRVEAFAGARSVPVLWLYTLAAEPLYTRLGWLRDGIEREAGQDVVLMKRYLPTEPAIGH